MEITNFFLAISFSEIFCTKQVSAFITGRFLTWTWDMSLESNRQHFKNIVKECGHPGGSGRFREEMYPLLLIAVKAGEGSLEMRPLSQGMNDLP